MIKWNYTKAEGVILSRIAERASKLAAKFGATYHRTDALMDVAACHCNGCALDLERLLNWDDGNFGHDVFGIRRHISRKTGELQNCFVPRSALPEKALA